MNYRCAISETNLRDRLELLFAQNRTPYRCHVIQVETGWMVTVTGRLPEQYQDAIQKYLSLAMALPVSKVNLEWRPDGKTIVLLELCNANR